MKIQSVQDCVLFLCTYAVLHITSLQDVRNMDGVSWQAFLTLPIIKAVFLFLNPGMESFWGPVADSFAGSAIGIVVLAFALVGLCGGADVIMILCVGFTVGIVDTIHSLLYASIILLAVEAGKAIKARSLKGLRRKAVPYIPYYCVGFVFAFVTNHFVEVF